MTYPRRKATSGLPTAASASWSRRSPCSSSRPKCMPSAWALLASPEYSQESSEDRVLFRGEEFSGEARQLGFSVILQVRMEVIVCPADRRPKPVAEGRREKPLPPRPDGRLRLRRGDAPPGRQ